MSCRAIEDGRVMAQSSDKTCSTGEGDGKPLQYSCLENPMNSMTRQKVRTLKDELPRLVGAQYATGVQWRNNSRKNEETEPKQKQHPVVDVTGDGNKVRCCKEQYCLGTWNIGPWIKANWRWSSRKSQLIIKDLDAGEDWDQEEKRATGRMRWLDGITNSLHGHEFEQTLGDGKGQEAWYTALPGITNGQKWLSDWKTTISQMIKTAQEKGFVTLKSYANVW